MTRTLTATMETAIAAQRGTIIYFIEHESSGGFTRLATAPVDISWNSQAWDAIGGALSFSAVEESSDSAQQGVDLTLSGVDQAIISLLLNNNVRGREVRIWLAHLTDTGLIEPDPLEIFRGRQLAEYRITEDRPIGEAGTVTVKTRVVSRLAALRTAPNVRTNEISHNDMLKRAGLATGDTFFRPAAGIVGKNVSPLPPPSHPGDRH